MTTILRSPGRVAALAAALTVLGGCALTADRLQQGDAHYRMATAYLQQSGGIRNEVNRRQAYSELAQALRLDAKNADYHRLLGAIRLADRNYVGAEQEIRTALKLRADFPEARNDLGSVFAAQGKLTEAVREFRAAAANPSYTTPQFARFWISARIRTPGAHSTPLPSRPPPKRGTSLRSGRFSSIVATRIAECG